MMSAERRKLANTEILNPKPNFLHNFRRNDTLIISADVQLQNLMLVNNLQKINDKN